MRQWSRPRGSQSFRPISAALQQSVRLLFDTFLRTGSAWKVVKTFAAQGLAFPRSVLSGPRNGELVWRPLEHYLMLHVLHNPRYAGDFVFGRHRTRKLPEGRTTFETVPREEWVALVKDMHPGYITWEQYEASRARASSAVRVPLGPWPSNGGGEGDRDNGYLRAVSCERTAKPSARRSPGVYGADWQLREAALAPALPHGREPCAAVNSARSAPCAPAPRAA